jgi:hypothetical protein
VFWVIFVFHLRAVVNKRCCWCEGENDDDEEKMMMKTPVERLFGMI